VLLAAKPRRAERTVRGRATQVPAPIAAAGLVISVIIFGATVGATAAVVTAPARPAVAGATGGPVTGVASASPNSGQADFRFLPALPQAGTPGPKPSGKLPDATLPIRATFYYGWYPEAWGQVDAGAPPAFHPSAGRYDSNDPSVVANHIRAMRYGGIDAALASWWGAGTRTDGRFPTVLAASRGTGLSWALNVELETVSNPDAATIQQTLQYIAQHYAQDPAYLRVAGRFVVFVGVSGEDRCEAADRWAAGNTVKAYLVLGAVPGQAGCDSQPDDWFAADPSQADQAVGESSYAISPGFARPGEAPRLARDPVRWAASIKAMVASRADFQLVGTFNEWADGSAIESASEWSSASGYGTYLDLLHGAGVTPPQPSNQPATTDPVLIGAGAIASCSSTNDEATAAIVSQTPGTVFTVGDNALPTGSADDYAKCYDPTWGAFLERTRPAAGSRDYFSAGADGYFGYFGAAAGDPAQGYYAYNLAKWRIYVLNSNCTKIGGCQRGSPEETWLRNDLRTHPAACIGAYWQSPRFSSGRFGDDARVKPFWDDLYEAGAEFVIGGHDRNYQRFVPMTSTGDVDKPHGIRAFVVGTGGAGHTALQSDLTGRREAGTDTSFGVLRLTLHPTGYEWQFMATPDAPYQDAGAAGCH
jgi:hypothetical protein